MKNQDYIHDSNIVQERYVVCGAWKELGKRKIDAVSVLDNPKLYKADPHNDRHVLTVLHKVLSSADIIIAHNGDQYDIKFTEARMLIQGLPPLPPIPSIDTLKTARNRFLFNANNLDYLGKVLGVGRKVPTSKGLWLRVLAGDADAIRLMVQYNKGDVALLERVYYKLRPYVQDHINLQLWTAGSNCPRCGSAHVTTQGTRRSTTQQYTRYQCQGCGGWLRDRKALKLTIPHRVI